MQQVAILQDQHAPHTCSQDSPNEGAAINNHPGATKEEPTKEEAATQALAPPLREAPASPEQVAAEHAMAGNTPTSREHTYGTLECPEQTIKRLANELQSARKRVKALKAKVSRSSRKTHTLDAVIEELKAKNLISEEAERKLEQFGNLLKTLVRSKLEYASSIWDPHLLFLSNSVESIQNRAGRFIVCYSRSSSVSSIKMHSHLPDLSVRRKIARLCLFHKIYFTNPNIKCDLFSAPSYVSSRIDHKFKVEVPSCRTNLCFNSFVPKTATEWNHLPASIASIAEPSLFKTAISNCF